MNVFIGMRNALIIEVVVLSVLYGIYKLFS